MSKASAYTLYENFELSAQSNPLKPALKYKLIDHYHDISYEELFKKTQNLAKGLLHLGYRDKIKVAVLCANRPEWVITDLGALSLGMVVVPIYPTLSAAEIKSILENSQAKVLILENKEHFDRICQIYKDCPNLEKIICMCQVDFPDNELFLSFSDLLHLGAKHANELDSLYLEIKNKVQRQDVATLVYTSGSTGKFKGVVLSHFNLASNVEAFLTSELVCGTDTALSILPLSHIFERTVGYYSVLFEGGTIAYAEDTLSIAKNIKEIEPTVMIGVPRFFEKVQKALINNLSGFRKLLFNWGLQVGYIYSKAKREGNLSFIRRFWFAIANLLLYRNLHKKMGLSRLRHFGCGGAPLARHIPLFFEALRLDIIEGYGLTESSPIIAMNTKAHNKPGTVGRPLPGVEVKIAPDGELLARGPNIMQGYYRMPEETKKALQNGYLHTGDIAKMDRQGFLKIVDRKKELLVLSNGKNVAPVHVEKKIAKSIYITQCIVIGDNRNYLTALVLPNLIPLRQKFKGLSDEELYASKEVLDWICKEIENHSKELARFERIKKFSLLKKELSFEGGELTPTMKIKRKAIAEKYAQVINEMYANKFEHESGAPQG